MHSPFTIEERKFASSVNRLATSVDRLIEVLERIETKLNNQ